MSRSSLVFHVGTAVNKSRGRGRCTDQISFQVEERIKNGERYRRKRFRGTGSTEYFQTLFRCCLALGSAEEGA